MLRLPNNVVQKALIKMLHEKMPDLRVYDFVPDEAVAPFVTLGSTVTNDISTKTEDEYKLDIQVNIWSVYRGKYEVNIIAQNLINLLTSEAGWLDLTEDDFFCYKQAITMYETYPEDMTGFNGVINLELYITNTKKE